MSKRSISEVTKVTDINREYIEKFIEEASVESIDWIEQTIKACRKYEEKRIRTNHPELSAVEIKKRVDRQYFGNFRSVFAHKFHSELFVVKETPTTKKTSLLDTIEKRRAALNAAT